MEPTITVIITAVTAALGALLSHGAEGFAKEAGKSAFETTKGLLTKLQEKWKDDADAWSQLERFTANPPASRVGFERVLADRLARQDDLRKEVITWIDSIGPQLQVVQKIVWAEKATGIMADEITEGRLKVVQEIEQVRDVTGVKIKRIGQ